MHLRLNTKIWKHLSLIAYVSWPKCIKTQKRHHNKKRTKNKRKKSVSKKKKYCVQIKSSATNRHCNKRTHVQGKRSGK